MRTLPTATRAVDRVSPGRRVAGVVVDVGERPAPVVPARLAYPPRPGGPLLPPRCLMTLDLTSQGYSHTEVAGRMSVSIHTVQRQLEIARVRLGARSVVHAVALAIRQGLM
jgi:DNA-binding CsgD family transcriptional regulator